MLDSTVFLRMPSVVKKTGIPRASVYEMMERGEFPKPVRLSPRAVAWIESEIEAWQRGRVAERNGGASAEVRA